MFAIFQSLTFYLYSLLQSPAQGHLIISFTLCDHLCDCRLYSFYTICFYYIHDLLWQSSLMITLMSRYAYVSYATVCFVLLCLNSFCCCSFHVILLEVTPGGSLHLTMWIEPAFYPMSHSIITIMHLLLYLYMFLFILLTTMFPCVHNIYILMHYI